jgi:hypothetical protein
MNHEEFLGGGRISHFAFQIAPHHFYATTLQISGLQPVHAPMQNFIPGYVLSHITQWLIVTCKLHFIKRGIRKGFLGDT